MRLSLKAKLTALISFLVLLVVLATSTVYLSSLTRQALTEIESKGEYVANETYHQARTVLAQSRLPAGANPVDFRELRRFVQARLAEDTGLASLMESAVGYSPTLYYVTITDSEYQVLVHNDPGEVGRRFAPAPPFGSLTQAGLLHQLRVIYGPARVYEVVLPLEMGGKPLGDVRVGVSTLFLRNQLTPDLRAALTLSLLAILLATLSAGLLSFRLLRPLETISRSVDRLARGEYSEPVALDRTDEWGILSSKLSLLGEQMRGEKAAFLQLKENLDQLFSNFADGLLLFDKQDRLVLATPAVSRFLGCAPPALARRPAAEVFSAPSPLHRLLAEAFRSRQLLSWRTIELPGEDVPRVAVSVQFVEEQGEPVASLVTLRDASTRAQLEDQIDIATKLAALARLTSGVAHEVKNPLNAMVLQLELLKSKLAEQGERVKPQLEILSAEIHRLDRVVKTFLDFTRPVEVHFTETDIGSLVREVFILAEPQARENNVRLVFEHDGALPSVRVDRDLMKQALLNLVLNGCQAMPSGGELKVTPHATPRRLELEIADQGAGIPPEARQKIFSLFYTTKPGGTGVGLAMAFRILQLHNGSLDFSSEVNRGTTFRISLPRP
jgi:signal transduction histidine kinase/HAMP domain-containing protein